MINFVLGLVFGIIGTACYLSEDIREELKEDLKSLINDIENLFGK